MSEDKVQEVIDDILSKYLKFVNITPELQSLLYDTDLLPEQITNVRDAISMAAVCAAYQMGAGTYYDA